MPWHRCGVPRRGQRSVVSPYWPGQQDQGQQPGLCGGKRGRALVANPLAASRQPSRGSGLRRARGGGGREPLPQEMPKPQPKWGSTCGRGDSQSRRSFLAHQLLNAPRRAEPEPPQTLVACAFTLPPPEAQLPEPPSLHIQAPGTLEFLIYTRGNLCCKHSPRGCSP